MDTNKDGKVGMGEYFKAVEARFVFLDQDKDGYITACDLAKVAALRKTKATPTPVVATPVKTPVKPADPEAGQASAPSSPAQLTNRSRPRMKCTRPMWTCGSTRSTSITTAF